MSASNNSTVNVDYEVIIVGGGMVGLSLAGLLLEQNIKVAVIDPKAVESDWPEDSIGQRVSAITRASERLFKQINAWDFIGQQEKAPYQRMFVWDGESSRGKIEFDASLIAQQNLGHIVENRVLRRSLFQAIERDRQLDWLCPERCVSVDYQQDYAKLELESGRQVTARLLVAADGAFSWLRKASGVGQEQKPYGHKAIVCAVKTEKPHHQTAWQRFDHHGPLAFLPLADAHHCSIVWSVDEDYADELLALGHEAFAARLSQAFESTLGEVSLATKPVAFPLIERSAEAMIAHRLALIGDAAHTIHPLAGQGVNLGFSDAVELATAIENSLQKGADIGLKYRLRPFERARKTETRAMQLAMQGFKRLFEQEVPLIQMARSYGLAMTDKHPLLKQKLIKKAMGL